MEPWAYTKADHREKAIEALNEDATITKTLVDKLENDPENSPKNMTYDRLMRFREHHINRALVHSILALSAPD